MDRPQQGALKECDELILTVVFSHTVTASEERRFFSFHEWGILVYEPSACRPRHEIRSTDIIPGTQVRPLPLTTIARYNQLIVHDH